MVHCKCELFTGCNVIYGKCIFSYVTDKDVYTYGILSKIALLYQQLTIDTVHDGWPTQVRERETKCGNLHCPGATKLYNGYLGDYICFLSAMN